MNKYYMVDYEFSSGEYGIPKQRLMIVSNEETIQEAIENYFDEFFGITYKDGENVWHDEFYEQAIRITGYREVPEKDALIIKKYLH